MTDRWSNGNVPLWLRILERQGIATFFALILLFLVVKVAFRHFVYLDFSEAQQAQQTEILKALESLARQQESSLNDIGSTLKRAEGDMHREHSEILDAIRSNDKP